MNDMNDRRRWLTPFTFLAAVVAAAVLLVLSPLRAQESAPQPVQWSAKFPSAHSELRPGQKTALDLTASIDSGWHVYAVSQPPDSPVIATQITVPDGQPLSLAGDIASPQPVSRMDLTVGKRTDLYENSASFTLPLQVSKKARAGQHSFEVDVRFQACNDRLCLQPRTQKLQTPVEITSRK